MRKPHIHATHPALIARLKRAEDRPALFAA